MNALNAARLNNDPDAMKKMIVRKYFLINLGIKKRNQKISRCS